MRYDRVRNVGYSRVLRGVCSRNGVNLQNIGEKCMKVTVIKKEYPERGDKGKTAYLLKVGYNKPSIIFYGDSDKAQDFTSALVESIDKLRKE